MSRALNIKWNNKLRNRSIPRLLLFLINFLIISSIFSAAQDFVPSFDEAPFDFFLDDEPLGNIVVLTDGETVTIPFWLIKPMLEKLLSETAYTAITGAVDRHEYIAQKDLIATGIIADVDFNYLIVNLRVPASLKRLRYLDDQHETIPDAARRIDPAFFSIYANAALRASFTGATAGAIIPSVDAQVDGAMNIGNWVAETAFTARFGDKTAFNLGYGRLVKDFRDQALRLQAGTVELPKAGKAYRISTYGIKLEKYEAARSEGYTSTTIRRTLRDVFTVELPAKASVTMNGSTILTKTLKPGKYQFSDIPLVSGINDMVMTITETDKEPISYKFVEPHDVSILSLGTWDFGVGIGMDALAWDLVSASGFVSGGLTHTLTGTAAAQVGLGAVMTDIGILAATDLGLIKADAAVSYDYSAGAAWENWGVATGLKYSLFFPGRPQIPSLGFGADWSQAAFTTPDPSRPQRPTGDSWRLTGQIQQRVVSGITLSAVGDYGVDGGKAPTFNVALGVSISAQAGASLAVSASVNNRAGKIDPTVNLLFIYLPKNGRSSYRYNQDVISGESSVNIDDSDGLGANSRSGFLSVQNLLGPDDSTASSQAGIRFNGDKLDLAGNLALNYNRAESDSLSYTARLDISSALAFADGALSMTRRISDSFALIVPDPSFGDQPLEVSNASQSAVSVNGQTSVLPSIGSYNPTKLTIETPGSPPNVAARDPVVSLRPGYRSGLVIRPGKVHSVVIAGRLVDVNKEPLTWVVGEIINADDATAGQFFCDDTGAFEIYDMDIGDFTIKVPEKAPFTLKIRETEQDRIDIGTVMVAPERK